MAFTMHSLLKLSTSKKALILVAILGVVAGLYFNTFFNPRQEELKVLKDDLNKLVEELNRSRAITRDHQKFKEQLVKLDQELRTALTQLPDEKEIPEILKNITNLGKDSNLEFTLFRPKAEEPQQFYAKVPIELTVLGSYHNIGIFFDKVSKLPRIINVVDFNISRAKDVKGKEESDALLRTSCLVNTYRFIEKKGEEKKSEEKKSEKKEPAREEEESPKDRRK
jgi:type IV pilus assembly protein PilO